MQAQKEHSPPKRSRSTTATRSPPSASAPAQCSPGAPPPNTITSKLVPAVSLIRLATRLATLLAALRPTCPGEYDPAPWSGRRLSETPRGRSSSTSTGCWSSPRARGTRLAASWSPQTGGTWREEATHAMLGMSAPEWSRYVHEELGVPLAPEEIDRRVVERVLEEYRSSLPLLPGAVAAVRALAASWPLGLASSSNRVVIDEVLRLAGLQDEFAVTVSSEEVARGKPAPDVYLAAIAGARRDRRAGRSRSRTRRTGCAPPRPRRCTSSRCPIASSRRPATRSRSRTWCSPRWRSSPRRRSARCGVERPQPAASSRAPAGEPAAGSTATPCRRRCWATRCRCSSARSRRTRGRGRRSRSTSAPAAADDRARGRSLTLRAAAWRSAPRAAER